VNREQLEHIVGAAANLTDEDEFVVIGSQSILGTHPKAPDEMLVSMEADIYPAKAPDKAISIDGNLGDGSRFHLTFGYYAHGVGPETVKAPEGWQDRLVRVSMPPRIASERQPVAYFLEVHDLVLSKCVAGRERDWEFARVALVGGLVSPEVLLDRVTLLPVNDAERDYVAMMLAATIEPIR
jgi:hypothetical protein